MREKERGHTSHSRCTHATQHQQHILNRVHVDVDVPDVSFTHNHTNFVCRKERIKNGTRLVNFANTEKEFSSKKRLAKKIQQWSQRTHTNKRAHTYTDRRKNEWEQVVRVPSLYDTERLRKPRERFTRATFFLKSWHRLFYLAESQSYEINRTIKL